MMSAQSKKIGKPNNSNVLHSELLGFHDIQLHRILKKILRIPQKCEFLFHFQRKDRGFSYLRVFILKI